MDRKTLSSETKNHPLTLHAREWLTRLARGPVPSQDINNSVIRRFHREKLTESVWLSSPYKSHKGGDCEYQQITIFGRAALTTE